MSGAIKVENYELAAKTRDSLNVSSSKPITPEFIENNLEYIIHPAVLQAVNELLKENYRPGKSVTIKQKEIVKKSISICQDLTSNEIFEKKWMDFESIFIKAGWKVKYDSPSWDESFEEYFTFSK